MYDPRYKKVSKDAKNLLSCMLEVNPDKRCTAFQAIQKHFIKKPSSRQLKNPIKSSVFKHMKAFVATMKLQTALKAFIATKLIKEDERAELLEQFHAMDEDGNGELNR